MSEQATTAIKRKILFLEWVRGSAALMVAITHVLAQEWADFNHFTRTYVDPGRVGVVAFFLVSGYVIPLSFQNQDIRTFLVRRMLRLYPVYILALTVYLWIMYRDHVWNSVWGTEVFWNYTMLQE